MSAGLAKTIEFHEDTGGGKVRRAGIVQRVLCHARRNTGADDVGSVRLLGVGLLLVARQAHKKEQRRCAKRHGQQKWLPAKPERRKRPRREKGKRLRSQKASSHILAKFTEKRAK